MGTIYSDRLGTCQPEAFCSVLRVMYFVYIYWEDESGDLRKKVHFSSDSGEIFGNKESLWLY